MTGMLTGSKLRMIRSYKGITQAQLAALAKVSASAIAEYELDKRELRTDTIRRLCQALGVAVTYTVDGVEISGP